MGKAYGFPSLSRMTPLGSLVMPAGTESSFVVAVGATCCWVEDEGVAGCCCCWWMKRCFCVSDGGVVSAIVGYVGGD